MVFVEKSMGDFPKGMRRLLPILLSLLALGGCDSSAASSDVVIRDSAGVRIVEYHAAAWQDERIAVGSDPVLAIGAVDGPAEKQLYRVQDAMRLSDGRLAILNSGASEVRFYSPDGRHLRTVGGQGAGPGEFQHPEWIVEVGDTLMVFDPFQDNGRLSLFNSEGDFIRSERVEVEGNPYPSPDLMLPDGTYVDEANEGSILPTEEGHVVYTRHIVLYSRTPSTLDTIVQGVAGGERYRERFANGMSQSAVPFGREAWTAIGSDRIYLGDGAKMMIDAYGFDGGHLMSIRVGTAQPEITDEEVRRWIEARLSRPIYEERPDAAERARTRFLKAPVPDEMPGHAEMVVDAKDRLWVRRYNPPWEEKNEWWVFDRDGRWLNVVSLPAMLEVFEIGSDYVLGLRTDDLDVEIVEMYALPGEDRGAF